MDRIDIVRGILTSAMAAVDGAKIPEDLRVTAFSRAIDLIIGVPAPKNGSKPVSMGDLPADGAERETPVVRIAQRLKVEPETVIEVFHEEDGEIEITVPSAKLDSGKSGGTRQLALLVAAGRQGAGLEEFTSLDSIRKVAEDFRRYDQANFAKTIGEMGDVFNYRGTSRSRAVRVSRPGWEAAAQLVRELGGGNA